MLYPERQEKVMNTLYMYEMVKLLKKKYIGLHYADILEATPDDGVLNLYYGNSKQK